MLDQTIPEQFAEIVSKFGDRDAVVSRAQGARLTYRELDQRSSSIAKTLQELGVIKGDRVAVSLGNNLEFGAVCTSSWGCVICLFPRVVALAFIAALLPR